MAHQSRQQVGANLRGLRKRAGLTQTDLAVETGLHHSTISDIEGGKQQPRGGTVAKLVAALGVTEVELLRGGYGNG